MKEVPSLNVADVWGIRDSSLLQQMRYPTGVHNGTGRLFLWHPSTLCMYWIGKRLNRVFLMWWILMLQLVSARPVHVSPYAGTLCVSSVLYSCSWPCNICLFIRNYYVHFQDPLLTNGIAMVKPPKIGGWEKIGEDILPITDVSMV